MWRCRIALSLIALGLPLRATAQGCDYYHPVRPHRITTQDDLDALADDCPVLRSDLSISPDFTGAFVLPGVVNASDITVGDHGDRRRPLDVTSIELPDLEYADQVRLRQSGQWDEFSAPKLKATAALSLEMEANLERLHMPSLETTRVLELKGNYTELSLPALRAVTGNLTVNTSRPIDIDLPLEHGAGIHLVGKIKSVNLPNLAAWDELTVDSDIRIDCGEIRDRLESRSSKGRVSCSSGSESAALRGRIPRTAFVGPFILGLTGILV